MDRLVSETEGSATEQKLTLYHVRALRYRRDFLEPPEQFTVILCNIHPLIWASTPPSIYRKYYFDEILDWREVQCSEEFLGAIVAGGVLTVERADSIVPMREQVAAAIEAAAKGKRC